MDWAGNQGVRSVQHDAGNRDGRLTPEERESWQRVGRRQRYSNGTPLVREGEPSRKVLLVERGLVKVISAADNGRSVLLAVRGPGEIVGDVAALDGGSHSASVFALGEVVAHALSPGDFLGFLGSHPRISATLLQLMARRLRESDGQRLEYGTRTVPQRMASRLLTLAEDYGTPLADGAGVLVDLRLTQTELADSVAASRDAVVNALRALRGVGAVDTDNYYRFIIFDPVLLRDIATGVIQVT